jgi:hypothetical protein
MDNQWSEDLRDFALELDIHIEFISTESKRANHAERAIRTAKNHIITTRAGFHPDFSHALLHQMKLALNVIHSFEYDDNISAYEGIHRAKFEFKRHPIAPLGCKVGCAGKQRIVGGSWYRRHVYWPGIKPFSHRQHGVVVYGANQTKPGISSIRPGCSLPINA